MPLQLSCLSNLESKECSVSIRETQNKDKYPYAQRIFELAYKILTTSKDPKPLSNLIYIIGNILTLPDKLQAVINNSSNIISTIKDRLSDLETEQRESVISRVTISLKNTLKILGFF